MKRLCSAVLLAATITSATGCVAWRRVDMTPAQVLADPDVQVIQVTRSDTAKVILYQPRILRDTLTGLPTERAVQKVAVPVADVTEVYTRYKHVGKTALAGLAIVGGVLLYSLLQTLNTQP